MKIQRRPKETIPLLYWHTSYPNGHPNTSILTIVETLQVTGYSRRHFATAGVGKRFSTSVL